MNKFLPLARTLAIMKALHWNHWTTHWQVMGNSYYGDHLLFQRFYTGLVDEIDGLAEKLVQMFGTDVVNNGPQSAWTAHILSEWEKESDLYYRAIHAEQLLQDSLKSAYEIMKNEGGMTLGLDDFLMATANAHETNLYLLGQRVNSSKLPKTAKNQEIVNSPHSYHPVKLHPPQAKRKKYPFQGFIDFQGLAIDVENKAGSNRSGTDETGEKWATYMHFHYGEIRGTEGTDGDKLDVYVGPNHDSSVVVVIHQCDPSTGKYDEDKVMLGFDSEQEAIGAYLKQYNRPGFYKDGEHTSMPIGQFWRWVQNHKNKGKKVTSSYLASIWLNRKHMVA